MPVADGPDDGQPETAAFGRPALRQFTTLEAPEHMFPLGLRDAWTVIDDANHGTALFNARRDIDDTAGRRVAQGVLDQVLDQHNPLRFVAEGSRGLRRIGAQVNARVFGLDAERGHLRANRTYSGGSQAARKRGSLAVRSRAVLRRIFLAG